uniref:Uncharacterized protein n=1 Tax=Gopherus evgoodei TaxID=1825980 RepID=A0A8C4VQX5_9SAUR
SSLNLLLTPANIKLLTSCLTDPAIGEQAVGHDSGCFLTYVRLDLGAMNPTVTGSSFFEGGTQDQFVAEWFLLGCQELPPHCWPMNTLLLQCHYYFWP